MESPPSEKHPWTTATLKSHSFAIAARKPTFLSNSVQPPISSGTLVANASCVSGLPHVMSKSSDEEEKENFLAQVEWLPVTSRSYATQSLTHSLTHSLTDR